MTHESARGLMDVSRFVALGYLQEVNRLFFYPIGLALTVEGIEPIGDPAVDTYYDPEPFAP